MWDFIKNKPEILFSLLILIVFSVIRILTKDWGEIMARILIGGFLLVPAIVMFYDLFLTSPSNEVPFLQIVAGIIIIGMGMMGLFMLFPQLTKFISKLPPKKCKICGQPARDIFILEGRKSEGTYCRRHIIEKFTLFFSSFSFPMIVFHPEQERRHCDTMYPYMALDEMMPFFSFQRGAVDNIRKILLLIKGKCQNCNNTKASIAYYPKGLLIWDGSGPVLEKVTSVPKLLCSSCTLEIITPPLLANKQYYSDNGLFAPYKQSGVYVNTYL